VNRPGCWVMEPSLENKWIIFLDQVIIWSIFTFILLLPLPHLTTFKAFAKTLPVIAWIIKMILRGKLEFKKDVLFWPIMGYCVACLFSLLHSTDVVYSLNEIRSKLISPVLLYLVIVNNVQRQQLRIIFYGFLISGPMISAYGIWEFIHGTDMLAGRALLTFHHPTTAGMYVSLLIALALGLTYVSKSWWGRGGIVICLLISATALFLTQARGAITAGLMAFAVFALLKDKRLLVIILLALLTLLPFLPKKAVERAESIVDIDTYTEKSSTMYNRYVIWQASVLMLKDKWLWGVGYGWKNVRPLLTAYKDKYKLIVPDPIIAPAHNMFLQEWLETGIIGIVMFLWLVRNIFREIWFVFRSGLKNLAEGAYISSLIAAISGLFVANMVDIFLRYKAGYIFWIITGLFMLLVEGKPQTLAVYGDEKPLINAGQGYIC
jgi:putative inorganic carbon (HCO3(-)) transporter